MKNNEPVNLVGESARLWNEIKNLQLNMFALPDQTVEKHYTPVIVEPSKLYMVGAVGAAFPALEETLGQNYNLEVAGKYIVVSSKNGGK